MEEVVPEAEGHVDDKPPAEPVVVKCYKDSPFGKKHRYRGKKPSDPEFGILLEKVADDSKAESLKPVPAPQIAKEDVALPKSQDDRWEYGRGDVDPVLRGEGGGGMLMKIERRMPDYEGTHGLPSGSVPPGARFDPVGPMDPPDVIPPFQMPKPHQPPRGIGTPDPDMMPPGN